VGCARRRRAVGIVLLGTFASSAINPSGAQWLIHNGIAFFVKELAAGVGCATYAFVFTYAVLRLTNLVTPVHVGSEEERGPDAAELGEAAYTLEPAMPAPNPTVASHGRGRITQNA
jgi:ammonia channel protein AmtB